MGRKTGNTYDLTREYGIGYTSKGEEFYFDIEDYELISQYTWYTDKKGYLCATIFEHRNIKMHRLVMGVLDNLYVQVDHINHKHNDNRKSELRIASSRENSCNQQVNKVNTSGVTGVSYSKHRNKWRAYITVHDKQISLGYYTEFKDAVLARLNGELKYFGEFAPQQHLFNEYKIEEAG